MALLQECLKKVNVKIKQITYRPAYDEGIHTNNMLNLLLSMIPNRNKTLSYAHGKLICGTCSSIYNKGRSAGEELGLHISFDYDNLLTARTLTFAEEDKVKKNNKKDSPVYHLEFDEKRIYFSSKKKKGTKEYYNHPSVFRKGNKNHIPFLGFSDIEHFEESQAYLIRSVLQDFLTTYLKYVSVNPIEYKKPTLLKAQDAEFRKEDELLRDMLSTSWIEIACHTTETGVEKLRNLIEQKSREYIKKLFGNSFEGWHEKDKRRKQICIRIVGDKDQEEKLSDSEHQTLDYRHLKEKMELIEKKIPTQDVMIKSEIEAATIKNIFRQILIKDYCIREALPQYMIERFKGCVITYAEKKKNNLYYFAQLTIAKDGSIAYKVGEPRLAHDGVITVLGENFESHEYQAALQLSMKHVLAIDMDGQANLTEALGLSIEEEQTVYGAMCGQYTLPLVKLHNGITVVPSCLDLSAAESELISEPGRELILKGLITKAIAKEHFDYIIIDCPPSLGLLTLNALTAADYIIIPVQAQYLAMRGMAKLMDIIRIVQERLNPNLKVGGIVITQFDRRKTLNRSVREIVNDSFHEKVFKTVIRDNVALAEAPINGKTIFEYNPKSNGASDYMSLAKEVLKLK